MGGDVVRGRGGEEGEDLHHHGTDEVIKQVLAPLGAEQALFAMKREHAFEGNEEEAGEHYIQHEEVEAEIDAIGIGGNRR